jgi:hypothetical protein
VGALFNRDNTGNPLEIGLDDPVVHAFGKRKKDGEVG